MSAHLYSGLVLVAGRVRRIDAASRAVLGAVTWPERLVAARLEPIPVREMAAAIAHDDKRADEWTNFCWVADAPDAVGPKHLLACALACTDLRRLVHYVRRHGALHLTLDNARTFVNEDECDEGVRLLAHVALSRDGRGSWRARGMATDVSALVVVAGAVQFVQEGGDPRLVAAEQEVAMLERLDARRVRVGRKAVPRW